MMIPRNLKENHLKSSEILIGCLLLLYLCSSLCHGAALGDQFESFDVFVVEIPDDIFQITTDVVNEGNILILTRFGELYATADHYYFAKLNHDYGLHRIPRFIQTSTKFMFATPFSDNCLCQFDRIAKHLSPVYPLTKCILQCDIVVFTHSYSRYTLPRILPDMRNSSFVFTYIGLRQSNVLVLRHFVLPVNVQGNEKRVHSDLFLELPANAPNIHDNLNFEQIGNYLYTVMNERILKGHLPPLRNFDAYNNDAVSFNYIDEVTSGGLSNRIGIFWSFPSRPYNTQRNRNAKVNSTTLAMTTKYRNWTRLWNSSTNKTTSICLVEEDHRVHAVQTDSSVCPEFSPHIRGVHFANDSLYLLWNGGWGRIFHLPSENKATTDLMVRKDESQEQENSPATTTIVYSLSGISVLGILTGVVLAVCLWRKRRNSTTCDGTTINSAPKNTADSRPLPTIPNTNAEDAETECYDMPYLDEGEFYDMIGDQDYDIINNDETSEITDQGAIEENNAYYSDQIQADVSCETSPQAPPQAAAAKPPSNLDNCGYLKPRDQHSSSCEV